MQGEQTQKRREAEQHGASGSASEVILARESQAFDEMNIVEIPFALLTRQSREIAELQLSEDGSTRLVAQRGHYLPSALAPRVFLSLMWMCKAQTGFQKSFTFGVRDLAENYLYRKRSYRVNNATLRAIEHQLTCIAHTRVVSDRWYDVARRRHLTIDAALIDAIKVLDEGGHNSPRLLEVTWGSALYESVTSNYTKPIDLELVSQIENPLELALYRLLDRQLRGKDTQRYSNIQQFARRKLGMTGKTLERGGRTSSNYVARQLTAAVDRLNVRGFSVRVEIDKTEDIFSVTFRRQAATEPNEVIQTDPVAELVRIFQRAAHGNVDGKRIGGRDRRNARGWHNSFGFEQSVWMIEWAVAHHQKRSDEPLYAFAGLLHYASVAEGAYKRKHASPTAPRGPVALGEREKKELWQQYFDWALAEYGKRFDAAHTRRLRAQVRKSADNPFFREHPQALETHLDMMVRYEKVVAIGGLGEREFRAPGSRTELTELLKKAHGVDPLVV